MILRMGGAGSGEEHPEGGGGRDSHTRGGHSTPASGGEGVGGGAGAGGVYAGMVAEGGDDGHEERVGLVVEEWCQGVGHDAEDSDAAVGERSGRREARRWRVCLDAESLQRCLGAGWREGFGGRGAGNAGLQAGAPVSVKDGLQSPSTEDFRPSLASGSLREPSAAPSPRRLPTPTWRRAAQGRRRGGGGRPTALAARPRCWGAGVLDLGLGEWPAWEHAYRACSGDRREGGAGGESGRSMEVSPTTDLL